MSVHSGNNPDFAAPRGPFLWLTVAFVQAAIVAWGLISALQGASIDYSANSHAPFASLEEPFVYIVYFSALIAGMFSFASSRVTSIVMGLVTVVSIAIALGTHPTADGLGLGLSATALLTAVGIRPMLVTIVLIFIARAERPVSA